MKKLPFDVQGEFLRDLVTRCVLAIVEQPEAAIVTCAVLPARVTITAQVVPSDMGLVLGTEGATANAIRRIVWTACKKTDYQKVDIDFVTTDRRRT